MMHPFMAFEPSGKIVIVAPNAFGGPGAVIRSDPASGIETAVSIRGLLSDPEGIAVAPDGDIFAWLQRQTPRLRLGMVTATKQCV